MATNEKVWDDKGKTSLFEILFFRVDSGGSSPWGNSEARIERRLRSKGVERM